MNERKTCHLLLKRWVCQNTKYSIIAYNNCLKLGTIHYLKICTISSETITTLIIIATLRNEGFSSVRLIMVGGHDSLCIENVEHLNELKILAENLQLSVEGENPDVVFKVKIKLI